MQVDWKKEDHAGSRDPGAVVVVDSGSSWPQELLDELYRQGFLVWRIDDARRLPLVVVTGDVRAVLVQARSLRMTDVIALRQCREHAPRISVIAVSPLASDAEVKRALDSGATAFLSLPVSAHQLRDALRSGDARREPTT